MDLALSKAEITVALVSEEPNITVWLKFWSLYDFIVGNNFF